MVDKNREANGVGDTFKQYSSTYEKTTIIDVKDEHRKHLNRDPIATKKEPLQGYVTKDIKFGIESSAQVEGWTGKQCIEGDYKIHERLPDKDLGMNRKFKQTVKNFSNNDGYCNPDRAFGIPSVRSDIDKRGMKSVADPLN